VNARQARHRYLVLLALRWLPVGLWVPITVLLPLDRGLTLAEAGLAASMQGFMVLALELPTGGLSDSWGRRPVLLVSAAVAVGAMALVVVADTFLLFAAVYLLKGVYRALDSGPLEAWYVDAALAEDPDTRLERGLSAGSAVLGLAIALGALISGALVAWVSVPGIPTLVLPVLLGLVVQLAGLIAIALLVHEPPPPSGRRRFLASVRDVPKVIVDGVRVVRGSRILACLLLVELFWGFGMVTFETLLPVRMADLLGGTEQAAAVMGPSGAVAWLASALGAALAPMLATRMGVAVTAGVLRIVHGVTVVGMALLAGPVGALTGYLACYLVHGGSNPVHMTLVHREVSSAHRSTVVSMNSMVSQPAGAIGMIVLTALAAETSASTAMVLGAVVLALAAPLYLPAVRAERRALVAV
jgi:MFS transporter, DHA1 family, tetracycline resistance protein